MSGPPPKALILPAHSPAPGVWWLLALTALVLWQAWLTLGLFGRERAWDRLFDDAPVISGRHALHLYHGYLGARGLLEHGSLSCFDPAFHAGYPKTPVFDSGSRPAELTLALAGGRYSPRAYKVGLAVLGLAVPLLVFAAARAAGLRRSPAVMAAALGLPVWWGNPCQEALNAGAVDLLLATLLVLAEAGLLLRYHRAPGPGSLLALTVTVLAGWFAHPLLMALVLPLFLVYYISVGARHRLVWHAALWGGLVTAVGVNAFWLVDWIGFWWIRVPARAEGAVSLQAGLAGLWAAPLWGGPVDRALALWLIVTAAAGVIWFHSASQRPAARLLGLGWAGFLALALLAPAWEPLARLGGTHLLVPALLFAAVPAAFATCEAVAWAQTHLRPGWTLAGAGAVAVTASILAERPLLDWLPRLTRPQPLQIGLGSAREEVVAAVRGATTTDARILWEDRRTASGTSGWTALLPLLTERSYVGGLDADAGIEHTSGGLLDGILAGRPLAEWTDVELLDYCDRYNIGWIVCWSERSLERFAHWPAAGSGIPLAATESGSEAGLLLPLSRRHSYALRGSARWIDADAQHIVLADVTPQRAPTEDGRGQVVLSLHYHAGMRVAPSRVRLARAEDSDDSIPFVRLLVAEPVTRVTITWDKR
jgi:hypothetical protein